ncbi:MAG: hypothetical protein H5U17_00985 [Defluviimonas sp.]|nr:hypothetical protein [Defluviimonas sp.]
MWWFAGIVGTVFVSAVSFVLGRVFSQSEAVLAEKRRFYEAFLRVCPHANDAYSDNATATWERIREVQAVLAMYAPYQVMLALSLYQQAFAEADAVLTDNSPQLHPAFKKAAKAQNDLILEMRRDALSWSAFGYWGKSRLPPDALEKAKQASL